MNRADVAQVFNLPYRQFLICKTPVGEAVPSPAEPRPESQASPRWHGRIGFPNPLSRWPKSLVRFVNHGPLRP